jgi:hypothetical protein
MCCGLAVSALITMNGSSAVRAKALSPLLLAGTDSAFALVVWFLRTQMAGQTDAMRLPSPAGSHRGLRASAAFMHGLFGLNLFFLPFGQISVSHHAIPAEKFQRHRNGKCLLFRFTKIMYWRIQVSMR